LSPSGASKTVYRLTKKQIHDLERILDDKININKQGKSWNAIKYIVKIISAMTLIPAPIKKKFDGNENNGLALLRLVVDDGKRLPSHSPTAAKTNE
jgi:hypothetical protein